MPTNNWPADGLDLLNMLLGLTGGAMDADWQQAASQVSRQNSLRCPHCGLTFEAFLQEQKFGCATCYKAFRQQLGSIWERVQRGEHYLGDGMLAIQDLDEMFGAKSADDELKAEEDEAVSLVSTAECAPTEEGAPTEVEAPTEEASLGEIEPVDCDSSSDGSIEAAKAIQETPKKPSRPSAAELEQQAIEQLRAEQAEAIEREDYEEAARLRDAIRGLLGQPTEAAEA